MNRASYRLPWWSRLGRPKAALPCCVIAKDAETKSRSSPGISVSPQRQHLGLYYLLYFDNIGQEEVSRFLRELLRHLRGPVVVLLDNSSTHHGEALAKLLDRHPRLHLEYFPSYAPELNPDEGVWSLAKRDLANGCPLDANELVDDVIRSINGIRTSPDQLRGCILESDLPSNFLS